MSIIIEKKEVNFDYSLYIQFLDIVVVKFLFLLFNRLFRLFFLHRLSAYHLSHPIYRTFIVSCSYCSEDEKEDKDYDKSDNHFLGSI